MKKLITTTLTVLACGAVYALPVGNPADASLPRDGLFFDGHCAEFCDPCMTWCDALSFRIGFYGDYVFNRKMQTDTAAEQQIEKFQLFTNAAYLAANFWDRIDIFATLGATSFNSEFDLAILGESNPGPPAGHKSLMHINADFSWSAGVRATLWECGCTTLGAEVQYFQANPHLTSISGIQEGGATAYEYPGHDIDCEYREWQIGIGLAHRFNKLVPYIAIKWSGAQMDFGDFTVNEDIVTETTVPIPLKNWENSQDVGFAVGLSILDCEKIAATVEFRCGDEQAIHANAQLRF